MKLLVSSKNLAKKLSEIPETECVQRATLNADENYKDFGTLTLITNTMSIDIIVHIVKFRASVKQENRRWDSVREVVEKCFEQPICLEISEGVVNVIFQY